MKQVLYLVILILTTHLGIAQDTSSDRETTTPVIQSDSTLIIVPTLVRSTSGEVVPNLDAGDFRLSDNGVRQRISMDDANQRLSVVVLMQTGSLASRYFQNYRSLDTLLNVIFGDLPHEVALVTFDSNIQQVWNFPSRGDGLQYALAHLRVGDSGATILDAVNLGIEMLQQRPSGQRRIILLLSQSADMGSKADAEDVVRHLGESSTAVYSMTLMHGKTHRHSEKHASPASGPIASATLATTLKAMREDTAAEVAALSGGGCMPFHDQISLEQDMATLAEDVHSRYMLSFSSSTHEPGFHTIAVSAFNQHGSLNVASRTSYWFDGASSGK